MFAVNDPVAFVARGNRAVAARVAEPPAAGDRYVRVAVTYAPRGSGYRAGDVVAVTPAALSPMTAPASS